MENLYPGAILTSTNQTRYKILSIEGQGGVLMVSYIREGFKGKKQKRYLQHGSLPIYAFYEKVHDKSYLIGTIS